jgi:hypothetical protein
VVRREPEVDGQLAVDAEVAFDGQQLQGVVERQGAAYRREVANAVVAENEHGDDEELTGKGGSPSGPRSTLGCLSWSRGQALRVSRNGRHRATLSSGSYRA